MLKQMLLPFEFLYLVLLKLNGMLELIDLNLMILDELIHNRKPDGIVIKEGGYFMV